MQSKQISKELKMTQGLSREEFIAEVYKEFERRRAERRPYELQWQLNMNFLMGNQYCTISGRGEVEDSDKVFFWQEREVYNHIAPIVETRLAKLSRVRPKMSVLPATADDKDIGVAKTSSLILESAAAKLELDKLIGSATMWSETCGTCFYKAVWDPKIGKPLGRDGKEELFEGEVSISVVPPYEIFPDSNSCQDIEACRSIIHARAYPVEVIRDIWNVEISGGEVNVFDLNSVSNVAGGLGYTATVPKITASKRTGHAMVLEYYEAPGADFPEGRLAVVAGNQLVHIGSLPFANGTDGVRAFPFIRQASIEQPGCFFGTCVTERAIPVQRAYNAVKNRKHEFLNRIAMGVLTVEDGSVDTDNLSEEGLSPGKILVYRQGSTPPVFMDTGRVPGEFSYEEDRLLSEFVSISGISELMRSSQANPNITSGTALQLLIEQDDTRLSITAELVKNAARTIAKHILRLYKQFAVSKRAARIIGGNGNVDYFYWKCSDISSEDIVFTTENEISQTPAQRQNFVFELLRAGLLLDENGKLSNRMRSRVLDLLGFGLWENSKDIEALHMKRAQEENLELRPVAVNEIDDHEIHIVEHSRYLLSGDYSKNKSDPTEILTEHIREHKSKLSFKAEDISKILSQAKGGES